MSDEELAEEYATRECCTTCKNINHFCKEKCECWTFAKKGVMFGYAKAKGDADKMKSRFLELCNLKDMRIKELEKVNEWHDLKKNPADLPKEEKLGQTFIVALAFNEQTQKYYCFDCAEYVDKGKFITHTDDICGENNAYKIIAWKETVLPEEVAK